MVRPRQRNYLPWELRDKLLLALAEGEVEDAAKQLGVTPHTAYAWDSRRLRGLCACGRKIHAGRCGDVERISEELLLEILVQRDSRQLSTHALAGMFRLNLVTVQRAVTGHPLNKRRKIFDPTHWNSVERRTLRRLYPLAPWAEILEEIPGRNKLAIERKASELKIRRRVKEAIDTSRLAPAIAALRERRLAAKLSHHTIAAEAQININSLRSYETGHVRAVPLDRLARWEAAIERLEVGKTKFGPVKTPRPNVTMPMPVRAPLAPVLAHRRSIFDLPHTPLKTATPWRRLDDAP
jgi:hypothetical protein